MKTKLAVLLLPLALAGCWEKEETEKECYDRLVAGVERDFSRAPRKTDEDMDYRITLRRIPLELNLIYFNEDLNVCDYTVLGTRIVKID